MFGEHQLDQVFSSVVATSTEHDTSQTERGYTIMAEDGDIYKTTIENVTADFTETGTTAFAESGATTLLKRGISSSFTTSLTEDSSSPTITFMKNDSSSVTERGIANVTEWGTSGTHTWSSEESLSGSSPFVVSFTTDVPSAFRSSDSVTGWYRSSAPVSFSSSHFNDTTALNDTDNWGFYGSGSPAWGPDGPWFVNTLDGYPYPSLYGWTHIVVASVVVTAIMLLIVLGNVLVIVAVARDRNLSGIQNWFITSLALSDLFVGLFIMPLSLSYELMGYWTFGNVLCQLWLSTDVMLCTASILNLVLISLDRYWSITRAVSYVRQRTKRRAVIMIGAVWVMSMIISLPPLVGWKRPQPNKFGYPLCVLSEEPGYVIYSTMGSFYLPLVVMVMVYLKIYLAARNRARKNLRKTPPVEANHCKSTLRSSITTITTGTINSTSTPKTDPCGKSKNAADRLSPTREMSSESPSPPPPPPPPPRSSVTQEDPEEMEPEVAQVTIESVSPSTPSPVGGDPSTALSFSADHSPVGPSSSDVASPSLVVASTSVHSPDVASSVVSLSVAFSSPVHSSDVASSVVQSSDFVPPSVVVPSSVVPQSVVHSSDVASSVVESSVTDSSVVPTSVVPPCVVASSVVHSSDVVSSVVHSSDVAPSSVVLSVVASSVVQSPDVASSGTPPSVVSPPVAVQPTVSSVRVRPQRINQARRSPTSLGTVNASIPPKSPPVASCSSAAATVESSHSERRRSAMANRRSCVSSFTHRRSNSSSNPQPRSNGVKDVEKMKRKMARSRERRATVVLGIVMASFIGCWLPFFSLYPITLLVGLQLPDKLFAVIFWLGYCNSALNPIIYTIFNRDFRLAFHRILFSRRTKRF